TRVTMNAARPLLLRSSVFLRTRFAFRRSFRSSRGKPAAHVPSFNEILSVRVDAANGNGPAARCGHEQIPAFTGRARERNTSNYRLLDNVGERHHVGFGPKHGECAIRRKREKRAF